MNRLLKSVLSLCCLIASFSQAESNSNVIKLAVLPDNSEMNVWYHLPEGYSRTSAIVFVMHGVLRNADDYRDNWISLSEKYGFIVLVPEFDRGHFPENHHYNLGNLRNDDGVLNPEREWSFSVIGRVFEAFKSKLANESEDFYIFGHSAGAQFVHRLLMFKPDLPVALAIAANAGWYTLPVKDQAFPYGLKDVGTDMINIQRFLSHRMVVLLGDMDNDPKDKYLRTTPEANLQGAHRYERGNRYFQLAKRIASDSDIDFNWQLVIAPGIAHENAKMAPFAAELISQHIQSR